MKTLILFALSFVFSVQVFSQTNFDECERSIHPEICVGKKLADKIDLINDAREVPVVREGFYRYVKGFEGIEQGNRKIETRKSRVGGGYEIVYYGSNNAIFTYFKCQPGSYICRSAQQHILILMSKHSFFIDWYDDSNGIYTFTR